MSTCSANQSMGFIESDRQLTNLKVNNVTIMRKVESCEPDRSSNNTVIIVNQSCTLTNNRAGFNLTVPITDYTTIESLADDFVFLFASPNENLAKGAGTNLGQIQIVETGIFQISMYVEIQQTTVTVNSTGPIYFAVSDQFVPGNPLTIDQFAIFAPGSNFISAGNITYIRTNSIPNTIYDVYVFTTNADPIPLSFLDFTVSITKIQDI